MSQSDADAALADFLASCYADPLKYVMGCFPWSTERSIQLVKLPKKYRTRFDSEFGPDEWACEFLDQLGKEIKARKFDGVHSVDPIMFSTASGHGIGKDQPYSLLLDTPDGQQQWSNIGPGSRLFGRNGQPITVIARHEQGVRPVYRVTLSDGTSTLAGPDHLWSVRGRHERRNQLAGYRVRTTLDLLTGGVRRPNGASCACQWELPPISPVCYAPAVQPINPYVVGVWLGDGTRRSGQLTSADQTIWDEVRHAGYTLSDGTPTGAASTRTLYGLRPQLRSAGLLGTRKLPINYLEASAAQRLAVLQGLLDTDGWVEAAGTVVFGSIYPELTQQTAWLMRSLGLVTRTFPAKQKWYRYKGERRYGQPFYVASCTWDGCTPLFRLARKQAKLHPVESRYTKRWIERIQYSHDEQTMCVTVDAPDALYLTNDFIPTHNSVLVAMLAKFILDTRPYSKIIVTATTAEQLKTKTWAEIGKWHRLSLTSHWFKYSAGRGSMMLTHAEFPQEWRCDAQTCREENAEAFQGLHAANSTPAYIFDEASGVPDKIYDAREGGTTDGEPMVFDFGNPTRNVGRFFENTAGRFKHRYIVRQIDSRSVSITNKARIQRWADDWGVDSDFFKIKVRGVFPASGDHQFIANDDVAVAMARPCVEDKLAPFVLGVDVARKGSNESVIYIRKGRDARSWPPRRFRGLDAVELCGRVIEAIRELRMLGSPPAGVFIDGTGIGGPLCDQLRHLGYDITEVSTGRRALDVNTYRLVCDEIWGRMRDAIKSGLCLPDLNTRSGPELQRQLTQRDYDHTMRGQIFLESKDDMDADGRESPDIADALALTFAQEVAPMRTVPGEQEGKHALADYDPLVAKW